MVHYRVHKTSPMGPILSQITPVLNLMPNVRTRLILFSNLRLGNSCCPISFRYSNHNFVRIPRLSHACYLPCLSHPPWLDLNNICSYQALHYDIFFTVCSSYVRPDTLVSTVSSLTLTLSSNSSCRTVY